MYERSGEEVVVPIEPALPEADAGAPMPVVLATEDEATIAYWTADHPERRVAVATFRPAYDVCFGGPNDEAFHGHPLFEAGLEYYTFAEVKNSPWVAARERQNRVHPRHDPARFASRRHFVLPFQDSTFECIAEVVEAGYAEAVDPAAAPRALSPMARLYAATGDAIVRLDESGDRWTADLFLARSGAQCLAVDPHDPDTVYAGLREGGVRRTSDGGRSWVDRSPPEPGVFSLAVGAVDGAVYAGTEPSRLFTSDDRGESWRDLEALLDLPSRPTWSFPPRPWTSHVRWIAPSPHDADLLLVGIELGGLMRSTDGGETWQDHRPGAQRDVHSLAWHPSARGRAYEAGGGGAALSEDAGESWRPADEGRDRHYTWSVAVDPEDPELWYVSASTGPFAAHGGRDPQARIYQRRGGEPWHALGGGLPEPLPAMPYALVAADGRLFAGLADGQIWKSRDRGDTWAACSLGDDPVAGIRALAYAEA